MKDSHAARVNVMFLLLGKGDEKIRTSRREANKKNLKYMLENLQVKRLEGHKSDNPTLYLGLIPKQCSALTSPWQSAHVLYMSPFRLCLHLACSSGIHRKKKTKKTGEIQVLFLSNVVFLPGRVWAAEWFRIWRREMAGCLDTHSNVSTGPWRC